jgi:RND family efflux transporter MFP subunit
MKRFLRHRFFYIGTAFLLILVMVLLMLGVGQNNKETGVLTTVELGSVRQLVSVSGISEAKNNAELSFSSTGLVESVLVNVGDTVEAGAILATIDSATALADRQEALAALTKAKANKIELVAGPQSESRQVTSKTITLKEQALATTIETEANKVKNALNALRSNELTAYSNDADEDAVAPNISGTFTCDAEGVYEIEVYSSRSESNYSYKLSGLESGGSTASTLQAIPLGTCGLRILFDANSTYGNTTWYVEVPNTTNESYVTYKNAYELAKTQAESAITLAEQDLALAKATGASTNAPARSEALVRADADIAQAEARLARAESSIVNSVLRAPFSGTVTELDISVGEISTLEPVITILADSAYTMTARVPEIDISKLTVGQKVEMVFDAKEDEHVTGVTSFISLKPIIIDGVSYFEAYIDFENTPTWMRSGLNADVDIILSETSQALRLPKRFVTETNGTYTVLLRNGETTATTTVSVTLLGNDGYVAFTGLNEGDIVVAP